MQSRLLANIDAQLGRVSERLPWVRLQAQRALYLARQGQHQAATAIVAAVRAQFVAAPNAEVVAWVSLVEAVNQFYAKPGPEGMDRMRRADVLAKAINHPVLLPLCSAWMAHFEFNASRMEETVAQARQVFERAKPDHHAAWARISLVLADAYHFAGRYDLAKGWYARVRHHVLADGDDAMLSAMLHNVAAFRTNNARIADVFNRGVPDEVSRAMLEVDSTWNYDMGIGVKSLATLVPLMRAQLLAMQRRFVDAISVFDGVLNQKNVDDVERRFACHHADRAWCLVSVGRTDDAKADVRTALKMTAAGCDVDDLACTHARLGATYEQLGNTAEAASQRALAKKYLELHTLNQRLLLELLADLPAVNGPAS